MNDSDEESSGSENNWPMNEKWMTGILKGDDKTEGKVKVNVIKCFLSFQLILVKNEKN